MAEAARARSRRTREDVVGILMMIVVDVPVLRRSIRWVGGSSSIRAQKRFVAVLFMLVSILVSIIAVSKQFSEARK